MNSSKGRTAVKKALRICPTVYDVSLTQFVRPHLKSCDFCLAGIPPKRREYVSSSLPKKKRNIRVLRQVHIFVSGVLFSFGV